MPDAACRDAWRGRALGQLLSIATLLPRPPLRYIPSAPDQGTAASLKERDLQAERERFARESRGRSPSRRLLPPARATHPHTDGSRASAVSGDAYVASWCAPVGHREVLFLRFSHNPFSLAPPRGALRPAAGQAGCDSAVPSVLLVGFRSADMRGFVPYPRWVCTFVQYGGEVPDAGAAP